MNAISQEGFALLDGVFQPYETDRLIRFVEAEASAVKGRGGVRNLLDAPTMADLAQSGTVRGLVEDVLGTEAKLVRGILFDKNRDANWKVPWHQDVTIAVDRRVEVAGYGPWSIKAAVHHVQPPRELLEQMISVRIHLDDCPEENGALKVIAGSHLGGKLSSVEVEDCVRRGKVRVCAMRSGGVLLMRPLLLHASSAASVPAHRRVIHFDYAAVELAEGLEWAEAKHQRAYTES